jgi:short-subunit dehydrogenase
VGLSQSLDDELRGTGVVVSCVMPGVVNTELTSGFPSVRLAKVIEPTDVAEAIVAALERPRLRVHVPRSMAPMVAITRMLPRRVREAFTRALGGDQVLLRTDPAQRAAYDERVRPEREEIRS